jgi:hypothetical protein
MTQCSKCLSFCQLFARVRLIAEPTRVEVQVSDIDPKSDGCGKGPAGVQQLNAIRNQQRVLSMVILRVLGRVVVRRHGPSAPLLRLYGAVADAPIQFSSVGEIGDAAPHLAR